MKVRDEALSWLDNVVAEVRDDEEGLFLDRGKIGVS
jgi:hypothetical protein